MSFLGLETFETIVTHTPLVSIDLLVRNIDGLVLLGRRINPPAKNYWFVPGGRIYKGETLEGAFSRITTEELGQQLKMSDADYQGLYEHFYEDSVFGKHISTHYIVNAFELTLAEENDLPLVPHQYYQWFSQCELLNETKVHHYSKAYFDKNLIYKDKK